MSISVEELNDAIEEWLDQNSMDGYKAASIGDVVDVDAFRLFLSAEVAKADCPCSNFTQMGSPCKPDCLSKGLPFMRVAPLVTTTEGEE